MAGGRLAAYVCRGCGIGERLATARLADIAVREGRATVCREHDVLCSADGVAMIREDLDAEGVSRVVIAACSRRAKTEAFAFEGVALTRVSLREGVVWVRPDTEEARESTQEMAEDSVRMGCAAARAVANMPSGPPHSSGSSTRYKARSIRLLNCVMMILSFSGIRPREHAVRLDSVRAGHREIRP